MDPKDYLSPEIFVQHCKRKFGTKNPTLFENPVYDFMIRSEAGPYHVRSELGLDSNFANPGDPDFCFQRFGLTQTKLSDGRMVFVAGEHEDFYDPDFCIYNDVVVTQNYNSSRCDDEGCVDYDPQSVDNTSAQIEYYGYARAQFPPTDFHTATLVGDWIYLIGSLGYAEDRRLGSTQVLRLNTESYQIESVATSGDNPGWISRHRAKLLDDGFTIHIVGGQVWREQDGENDLVRQLDEFELDTRDRVWRRVKSRDDWTVVNIHYDDQGFEMLMDDEFASTPQGERMLMGLRNKEILQELGYSVTSGEDFDFLTGETGGHTIHVDGVDVYCNEKYECLNLVIQGRLDEKAQSRLINEIRSLLESIKRRVKKVRIEAQGN